MGSGNDLACLHSVAHADLVSSTLPTKIVKKRIGNLFLFSGRMRVNKVGGGTCGDDSNRAHRHDGFVMPSAQCPALHRHGRIAAGDPRPGWAPVRSTPSCDLLMTESDSLSTKKRHITLWYKMKSCKPKSLSTL